MVGGTKWWNADGKVLIGVAIICFVWLSPGVEDLESMEQVKAWSELEFVEYAKEKVPLLPIDAPELALPFTSSLMGSRIEFPIKYRLALMAYSTSLLPSLMALEIAESDILDDGQDFQLGKEGANRLSVKGILTCTDQQSKEICGLAKQLCLIKDGDATMDFCTTTLLRSCAKSLGLCGTKTPPSTPAPLTPKVDDKKAMCKHNMTSQVAQCSAMGWPSPGWKAGAKSDCTPVGIAGNSMQYEQYQILHPCCPKESCSRSRCVAQNMTQPDAMQGGRHAFISSAYDACAINNKYEAECWGTDTFLAGAQTYGGYTKKKTEQYRKSIVEDPASYSMPLKGVQGIKFDVISVGGSSYLSNKGFALCTSFPNNDRGSYACGVTRASARSKAGEIRCWGCDTNGKAPKVVTGQFFEVASANMFSCGLEKYAGDPAGGEARCWGEVYGTPPTHVRFVDLDADGQGLLMCGLTVDSGVQCWGPEIKLYACHDGVFHPNKVGEVMAIDASAIDNLSYNSARTTNCTRLPSQVTNVTAFSAIAVGGKHVCGLTVSGMLRCWGQNFYDRCGWRDHNKHSPCKHPTRKMFPTPGDPSFNDAFVSITASRWGTCGILKSNRQVRCWGNDAMVKGQIRDNQFLAISLGENRLCGVKTDGIAVCNTFSAIFQTNDRKGVQWQNPPPTKTSFKIVKSCAATVPPGSGLPELASCTKCPKNTHHTILKPALLAGTCTVKECPLCKPRACCDKNHKHYVINTDSMMGVCIRHDNDCTALCMPQKADDWSKPRVCTKGCNKMVRVGERIVTCQAEKRVKCETSSGSKQCTSQKWIHAVSVCKFSDQLWLSGASCMVNHIYQSDIATSPRCTAALSSADCRSATVADQVHCSSIAMIE